jgi:hypothetical protein
MDGREMPAQQGLTPLKTRRIMTGENLIDSIKAGEDFS